MKISYKVKDCYGNIEKYTFHSVASWKDEKSLHDPYVLRVLRDASGKALAGPMVGQFFDFVESQD